MIKVEVVGRASASFGQVLALWRSESTTLGFMPDGGFEQAAASKTLLAAVDQDGSLAGYLLYRCTRRKQVAIVHLCIAPTHRNRGVARLMVEDLKRRCKDSFELRLRCRRDFAANTLWPKLGFVPVAEHPAKRKGEVLVTWRYELETLPLLRMLSEKREDAALRVVIDANVFIDLDEESEGHRESAGLLADWLTEFVELHLTEEILALRRKSGRVFCKDSGVMA